MNSEESTAQATKPAFTPSREWKKKAAEGSPLVVPSGNTALVRNPGMQAFLTHGLIPNSLMSFIQQSLKTGKAPDVATLDVTEDTLVELSQLADSVVLYCVVEPKIYPCLDDQGNLIPMEGREADKLYVDEVDVEDKMFIFQFACGGTRDIEAFRAQSAQAVGHVANVPSLPLPTKRTTPRK